MSLILQSHPFGHSQELRDAFIRGKRDTSDEYLTIKKAGYGTCDVHGMALSDLAEYENEIAAYKAKGDEFHVAFLCGCATAAREIASIHGGES